MRLLAGVPSRLAAAEHLASPHLSCEVAGGRFLLLASGHAISVWHCASREQVGGLFLGPDLGADKLAAVACLHTRVHFTTATSHVLLGTQCAFLIVLRVEVDTGRPSAARIQATTSLRLDRTHELVALCASDPPTGAAYAVNCAGRRWELQLDVGREDLSAHPATRLPEPLSPCLASIESRWHGMTAAVTLGTDRIARFSLATPDGRPLAAWVLDGEADGSVARECALGSYSDAAYGAPSAQGDEPAAATAIAFLPRHGAVAVGTAAGAVVLWQIVVPACHGAKLAAMAAPAGPAARSHLSSLVRVHRVATALPGGAEARPEAPAAPIVSLAWHGPWSPAEAPTLACVDAGGGVRVLSPRGRVGSAGRTGGTPSLVRWGPRDGALWVCADHFAATGSAPALQVVPTARAAAPPPPPPALTRWRWFLGSRRLLGVALPDSGARGRRRLASWAVPFPAEDEGEAGARAASLAGLARGLQVGAWPSPSGARCCVASTRGVGVWCCEQRRWLPVEGASEAALHVLDCAWWGERNVLLLLAASFSPSSSSGRDPPRLLFARVGGAAVVAEANLALDAVPAGTGPFRTVAALPAASLAVVGAVGGSVLVVAVHASEPGAGPAAAHCRMRPMAWLALPTMVLDAAPLQSCPRLALLPQGHAEGHAAVLAATWPEGSAAVLAVSLDEGGIERAHVQWAQPAGVDALLAGDAWQGGAGVAWAVRGACLQPVGADALVEGGSVPCSASGCVSWLRAGDLALAVHSAAEHTPSGAAAWSLRAHVVPALHRRIAASSRGVRSALGLTARSLAPAWQFELAVEASLHAGREEDDPRSRHGARGLPMLARAALASRAALAGYVRAARRADVADWPRLLAPPTTGTALFRAALAWGMLDTAAAALVLIADGEESSGGGSGGGGGGGVAPCAGDLLRAAARQGRMATVRDVTRFLDRVEEQRAAAVSELAVETGEARGGKAHAAAPATTAYAGGESAPEHEPHPLGKPSSSAGGDSDDEDDEGGNGGLGSWLASLWS